MNDRSVHPAIAFFLAALLALLLANVFATSFEKLGLPHAVVPIFLTASIAGSFINIPLWRSPEAERLFHRGHVLWYRRPAISGQVVALNVGGAITPLVLSLWLLPAAPLLKVALATALVALLTNRISVIRPGLGIVTPVFAPPLAASALGLLLAGGGGVEATRIAYISGSMGTLIGADLLNLARLREMGPGLLSIGGAGLFDGVFLVGIVAVFLT